MIVRKIRINLGDDEAGTPTGQALRHAIAVMCEIDRPKEEILAALLKEWMVQAIKFELTNAPEILTDLALAFPAIQSHCEQVLDAEGNA